MVVKKPKANSKTRSLGPFDPKPSAIAEGGWFKHADRVQADHPQPPLDFFFWVSSVVSSVPPAPLVLPLQPLLELPAPDLFPLHALLPVQPLKVSVDPDIRLAMHRPDSIFFRSLASILSSCLV